MTYRVLIADDDADLREALSDVLEADRRFEVVARADSAVRIDEVQSSCQADLVLLDVRMPGGGPGAVSLLRSATPAPVVVAVSASTELALVTAMVRAGVAGYLPKGRLGESFPDLVARCAEGQVVLAVPHAHTVLRSLIEGRTAADAAL